MTGSLVKSALAAALLATGLMGCSSSGGGAAAGGSAAIPNVTISGAISAAGASVMSLPQGKAGVHTKDATLAVSLANLEVYVIYTSGVSLGIKQATVDATSGAWSFDVPLGSQINAVVRNSATAELVGPITFVDPSNKDMNGNSKESTVTSFKSAVSLGTIVLTTSGKFQVDVSAPAIAAAQNTVVAAPSSRIDFSGAWTIAAYDGTIPAGSGYVTAQVPGSADCPTPNNCHGIPVGMSVYFLRLAGKKFSYTGGNCATYKTTHSGSCATTDGTVDATVSRDAASIWDGATSIGACGYKVGFDQADALASGQLDVEPADLPMVDGHAMTYGRVVFSTPTGFGGDTGTGNNLPWMYTGAASDFAMPSCFPVSKTGTDGKTYTLNACKGTLQTAGTVAYGAGYGGAGGCKTSEGVAVNILNWPSLNTSSTGCDPQTNWVVAGMKTSVCHYAAVPTSVASAAAFNCTNTYGTYSDTALSTAVTGDYIGTYTTTTAGTLCKNIADPLQKYRCYANAYFQHKPNSGCSQEYSFNWDATSTSNFVVDDHRDKPRGNFLTNIVDYSADGQSFTLEDHEDEGVQVTTGSGSTLCHIDRGTLMKGTKVTDSKILLTLEQTTILKSTYDNICVAAKNDSTSNGGYGSQVYQRIKDSGKMMFYITK